ncbi:hybrid-cluster NAD(P)-dependent oxidoreductase [Endozoicomonas sp. OPT23]|uniref:hybrid-cluster NAD(P)-dependent oxidoreductase n=1 Tax=Endozoicomonas sp. OPT23 TaxID=2072845 RepID=UPI00129A2C94|nr:hybrid-cluster NAD(P)-dependent oxidoreductase [Endozoicomonas sp. OPT23]MRI33170.1 hybrid-cluster NAD(P)-dependent oxidoreductase [Endozoicomonas sp. OPT23]
MIDAPSVAEQSEAFSPVNTQTWANGRHSVHCVKVIQETWDVKTFCFMAEQPVMFFFKPGQFVTLELEIDGKQIMRSYTISSSPSVPYSFSITVKRDLGGLVSNWLHDNLEEGFQLAVHGPVGNFNCIDFPAKKVLLLSGGVGITPVMSMARWFFDTNADVDMTFVHSARTPRDIVFHRELEHMDSRITNFSYSLICEKVELGQHWAGYRGYLDPSKLAMIAPDFMDREIFCCGPVPYMQAVKRLLDEARFDMSRYHEEFFGEMPVDVREEAIEQADIAQEQADAIEDADLHTISFSRSGKEVEIMPGETLYTAATKADLYIPKACGMGICGTCKVQVQKGSATMEHNGGITEQDIEDGFVLSCCSVPKENMVVDF